MLRFLTLVLFFIFSHSNVTASEPVLAQKDTLQVDRNSVIKQRNLDKDVKEKYTSEEYNYETNANPNNWFSRLKKWFVELISDLFNIENRIQAQRISQLISRVFYFLIVLAVIYFIVKAVLRKEGRWIFGRSAGKKLLHVQDIESNIYQTDFKQLIEEAVAQKNYRLAIRYYYVWFLKELSEKGHLEFDVEKTNSDYINEIKESSLKKDFSYASYLYNYIWYGEFNIALTEYDRAAVKFEHYIKSVKK
ncbi:DUF4129 domain-containing protein [Galbibacter sp. BG1]|uniref:DUF4129 domain-containing protein n=1 Tax=Galbibacter sp. BG1 TaxID=1170699 RepID=UPI0015B87140|nr:DUF4129 domain-containing protein [Galbibacter sp. BG1]QLE01589.1 DUF4129 domain-containing protein [Galbibacter sp. BG1]